MLRHQNFRYKQIHFVVIEWVEGLCRNSGTTDVTVTTVTWLQKLLILDRLTCLAVLKGQPSRGSSLPFNSAELWKITWQPRSHRASALLWHPPLNLTFRFKSAPLLRFSSIQCCDLNGREIKGVFNECSGVLFKGLAASGYRVQESNACSLPPSQE